MSVNPSYYSVYYDVTLPKDIPNAMFKCIDRKTFNNLVDKMEGKKVYLDNVEYDLVSVSTFHVENTVENMIFAIVDVKKSK